MSDSDQEIEPKQQVDGHAEVGDGKTTLRPHWIAGERIVGGSMVYVGQDGKMYKTEPKEPDRIVVDNDLDS